MHLFILPEAMNEKEVKFKVKKKSLNVGKHQYFGPNIH